MCVKIGFKMFNRLWKMSENRSRQGATNTSCTVACCRR